MLKKFYKKKIFIIIGCVIGALLLIYLGFSIYFMNHFFFRTTINGMGVSGCSVKRVQSKMEQKVADYELVITERDDTTQSIKGSDIELTLEWNDSVEQLLDKQNGFAWIGKLFHKNELSAETVLNYNQEKLKKEIESLPCMEEKKQVDPVDATISEYVEGEEFSIIPSVEGTAIDLEALNDSVEKVIFALEETLSLEEEKCYKQPQVTADDEQLIAALEQFNQSVEASITYTIGEKTQVLDVTTFGSWLTLSEDLQMILDADMLDEYVSSLSRTYNTCYSAKTFATSYGATINIPNSHYGWKVDKDAEKAAITEEIKAGEAITRDLHYSMTANSHDGNDYGNSYVEINLTAQHLFLYENGNLIIETDFVSGDVSDGNATPTGIWGITYTQKNATLRGDDYATPVSFWMPYAGNVGMHDATWRGSFGGDIYKRNGSHGCVNLPYSAAKKIFEHVYTNYPVIVYELPGTEDPRIAAREEADAVMNAINGIGIVTLESGETLNNVRASYDALSELAKSYVINYTVLTDAEAAYAALVNIPQ